MDRIFGSDDMKNIAQPVEDLELTRLKNEEKKRLKLQEDLAKEEKSARSRKLRGSKSLMSGGYRGYEEDEVLGKGGSL
tara:strand:- start:12947 stop:13180 length:234 start_codon:yes stop_codon:yes gene_type:complete